MYDTIIIGAGPAGMTAAIYTTRRNLKTLVLSRDIGGQITKTNEIENYPGFAKISGVELAKKLFDQAKSFGAEMKFEEAKEIKKIDEGFIVKCQRNEYETKTIILAFGKSPRELDIPGEEEFKGRGVTYCATCDAPFFKDKIVAVVGGGNSALDAALLASSYAKKVILVHRGKAFTGEQILVEKVMADTKIETIFDSNIAEIKGDKTVSEIILTDGTSHKTDGVIVEIGFVIDRKMVEDLIDLDEKGQVKIDELQRTSLDGIFAAGDLTTTPYKQMVISAGEGAKAALSVFDYLQKKAGKRGINADWH